MSYREGLGRMIHEVSSVLCNWSYFKQHGSLTEDLIKKGIKRLSAAEDFGRAYYREPKEKD